MAREQFKTRIERERAGDTPPAGANAAEDESDGTGRANNAAMSLIPIIELCRHCPGMVTAMGVSMGLPAPRS